MLFAFVFFISSELSKSPIILLPGVYGTNLHATYENTTKVPSYCPKEMNDELLWVNPKYLVPPFFNCLAHILQLQFDNQTNQISNIPGVQIDVHDFGGKGSVDYIVKLKSSINKTNNTTTRNNIIKKLKNNIENIKGKIAFYDNMNSIIEYLSNNGYKIYENLFVAPYDWRKAPFFVDDFWPRFKELIETAYVKSNNRKVTLIGYSMGSLMLQEFLSSKILLENSIKKSKLSGEKIWTSIKDPHQVISEEWKSKYLEKVIFLAPSFSGNLFGGDMVIREYTPFMPFIHNEYLGRLITSLPGFYALAANFELFGDTPVERGPDGRNYTTSDITNIIINYTDIKPEYIPLMNIAVETARHAPIDIGENIPVAVIYNSKVPTVSFMDYKYGWKNQPIKYFDGEGDGTVLTKGAEFVCKNWSVAKRPILCVDLNQNDKNHFDHPGLLVHNKVHELVLNISEGKIKEENEPWMKKQFRKHMKLNEHFELENI